MVQFPDAGSPVKTTLPVLVWQSGWVTLPGIGWVGREGGFWMRMAEEGEEVHPALFVTVKV